MSASRSEWNRKENRFRFYIRACANTSKIEWKEKKTCTILILLSTLRAFQVCISMKCFCSLNLIKTVRTRFWTDPKRYWSLVKWDFLFVAQKFLLFLLIRCLLCKIWYFNEITNIERKWAQCFFKTCFINPNAISPRGIEMMARENPTVTKSNGCNRISSKGKIVETWKD